MSRDVCFPRSRCRRFTCRTTLLALTLAVPTGTASAQSPIPFRPGLVLTYVMRNLSDTADREFDSTVVKVTPEETEFAVDIQIRPKPGGPAVKTFYHRHWRMVETEPKGYNCGN